MTAARRRSPGDSARCARQDVGPPPAGATVRAVEFPPPGAVGGCTGRRPWRLCARRSSRHPSVIWATTRSRLGVPGGCPGAAACAADVAVRSGVRCGTARGVLVRGRSPSLRTRMLGWPCWVGPRSATARSGARSVRTRLAGPDGLGTAQLGAALLGPVGLGRLGWVPLGQVCLGVRIGRIRVGEGAGGRGVGPAGARVGAGGGRWGREGDGWCVGLVCGVGGVEGSTGRGVGASTSGGGCGY